VTVRGCNFLPSSLFCKRFTSSCSMPLNNIRSLGGGHG
jgi:hypothetical protein